MSKKRKKVELCSPKVTGNIETKEIAWSACCRCQRETSENLSTPFNSILPNVGETARNTYNTLADNLKKFEAIGALPTPVSIKALCREGPLGEELYRNKARFHKSCKIKYSTSKLPSAPKTPTLQGHKMLIL